MQYRRGREDLSAYEFTSTSKVTASPAQRKKVDGLPCIVCGGLDVDAAHIVPQRQWGGCKRPGCVIPLCRAHHLGFDLLGGPVTVPLRSMLDPDALSPARVQRLCDPGHDDDELQTIVGLKELVRVEFEPEISHIAMWHSDVPFELLLDALRGNGWPGLGNRRFEPCPGIPEKERLALQDVKTF